LTNRFEESAEEDDEGGFAVKAVIAVVFFPSGAVLVPEGDEVGQEAVHVDAAVGEEVLGHGVGGTRNG
jgi:hypothetical protein